MKSSTRVTARGSTLMEVMVVGTVFLLLLTAVLLIYTTTVRVERQVGVKSDIDRVLMAAVRHIDASLKTSRLVSPLRPDAWTTPAPVQALELRPLKMGNDGAPAVTAEGFPEWGDPFSISFEPQGDLVRVVGGDRRVLAPLGSDGTVTFLRPNKGMLEMDVKIVKKGVQGYQSSRETSFQFRLFNQ